MNREMTLAMRLQADASRMVNSFLTGERSVKRFVTTAKTEFNAFKGAISTIEGRLAGLGLTIGATATLIDSAKLDKQLKQLQLSSGATADETERLRKELFDAQRMYGQNVDELKGGVDALIAGGKSMKEATATVMPLAQTVAVAKTNVDDLAKAMGVASQQFDIDLSDTEKANLLLDKMVVAGRSGYAELENLPDVFSRVGANAKAANLDLDKTLALVETLSLNETDPNRLGTLVDSTLRVFTNLTYMRNAQKATRIKFFEEDGSRRDPLKVLGDIESKYKGLKTDAQKSKFIFQAFGAADADTIKGLRLLLDGGQLKQLGDILGDIKNAKGTIKKDLDSALDNNYDQVKRLGGALKQAADGFAQPINDSVQRLIKYTLDSKEKGGLGMDGGDILLAGGGAAMSGLLLKRFGPKILQSLGGKITGLGTDVATGKALEAAAGVMPVFVVNMPAGFGGVPGVPDLPGKGDLVEKSKKLAGLGTGLKNVGLAVAPLAAMYGVTQWAGDTSNDVGRVNGLMDFSKIMNKIFNYDPEAKQKAWRDAQDRELRGQIQVTVHDDRAPTVSVQLNQPGIKTNVNNGQHMLSN